MIHSLILEGVKNFFSCLHYRFYNPFNVLKIDGHEQSFSDFQVKQLIDVGDNTGISFQMERAEINEDY